jgi:hypothetical protein
LDLLDGSGKMSLRRCELVGERYPCHGDEVSRPAWGVCRGLKSDEGEAEEINDE